MARLLREQKPVRDFLEDLKRDPPVRVAGTAIFLDQKASGIPRALLNNIKFNRVMHEHVVLLTVVTREQPRIAASKRLTVTPVCEGIVRVVAQVGFMEKPNITEILREAETHGVPYEPECTTYFLSREELLPGRRSDLPPLRRKAFMQMARNAQVIATTTDCLPTGSLKSAPGWKSNRAGNRRGDQGGGLRLKFLTAPSPATIKHRRAAGRTNRRSPPRLFDWRDSKAAGSRGAAVDIQDDVAVVGDHALAPDGLASHRHELPSDIGASHRDHLDREGEPAQGPTSLESSMMQTNLARRRRPPSRGSAAPPPLISDAVRGGLIGAVDIETQGRREIEIQFRNARGPNLRRFGASSRPRLRGCILRSFSASMSW